MELWQQEWKDRITRRAELERFLELTPEERAWFDRYEPGGWKADPAFLAPFLPFALTRSWLGRMGRQPDDPLRIQTVPRIAEARQLPCESSDPLFEAVHSPLPGLVHRYEDRVLFYAGRQCGLYCRYCFRRHLTADPEATGQPFAEPGVSDSIGRSICDRAREASQYLKGHREVKELLLSGGDPLTLPDETLTALIEIFRAARGDLIIRIGSRMPVVLPSRITSPLARLLGTYAPIYMIIQVNHPRELSPEVVEALQRLGRAGIPLLNQSVFLRGVNDSEGVLRDLSSSLLAAGVIPYYLFQGDLVAGTGHLRAPLSKGISIMRALRQRLSGLATPRYAVDLPGGGGKIVVPLDPPPRLDGGNYHLTDPQGREFSYPAEG